MSLPGKSIGFFSPLAGTGVESGYSYAAVQLIKAWQRRGVAVWTSDVDAPVIFNMGQPHFYERVEGALNIGYTPWESTGIPVSWPKSMNRMDEIWTTCTANAQWFKEGGVEVPIRVLHHGLNREHFPLQQRSLQSDPFKFLHIGGDAKRKGAEIVYRIFKQLYGDNPDVQLTLKGRRFDFQPTGSNIKVITDVVSQEDMTQLYLDHHAMIYPTRGEGFGFIPFQSAATGMPTAVTDWSGPVDYMQYCYPIRVERLIKTDYPPHEGLWAEPAEDSIALWMDLFVRESDTMFKNSYQVASTMDSYWSWDYIADSALKFFSESLISLGT